MLKLLNHTVGEKKKLTVLDYNCRNNERQFDIVVFPDDKCSVVKLYTYIEKEFMPHVSSNIFVNRFFRRDAVTKVMKVSSVVVFK